MARVQRTAVWQSWTGRFLGVLCFGAACLASSAALTWATAASILTGLALAALIFISLLVGLFDFRRYRRGYERYRESNISYVFAGERILTTWRYGQSSLSWPAIDRVVERGTLYLFRVGNGHIYIPKRDIQPHGVGDFMPLLRERGLLKEHEAL